MYILVAVSDRSHARLLVPMLRNWGYSPIVVGCAEDAVTALTTPDGPRLALIGDMGPGSAVEVCRQVRAREDVERAYLLVISLVPGGPDVSESLGAGADDYVAESSGLAELAARVEVGKRTLVWQDSFLRRWRRWLTETAEGRALLIVCATCKKVRTPDGSWELFEDFLVLSGKSYSHGFCPCCYDVLVEEVRREEHAPGINVPELASGTACPSWN